MSDASGSAVEHLFRREAGSLLAALLRVLGARNLALAEDVVQDALYQAMNAWRLGGVPENPSAWLFQVARNRAVDLIRRERKTRTFAPELQRSADSEWTLRPAVLELFARHEIADDLLRTMFCCCPENLSPPAQVALILKILCGFSTGEIARALLLGEAALEKQLARGRQLLQRSGKLLEVSGVEKLRRRIEPVHRALYLLFSEGYHGSHPELAVRAELCGEALRLCRLLARHQCALPATHALHALVCFGAARLPSRLDTEGELVLLPEQDRTRWDQALMGEGFVALERSGQGEQLTRYHVEAGIAHAHCSARSFEQTDWARIVELYDLLLRIEPSPVVELNRAIALAQLRGPDAGIAALQKLAARGELSNYPFLPAALGDLQLRAGRPKDAAQQLRAAIACARNPVEAKVFAAKLAACGL